MARNAGSSHFDRMGVESSGQHHDDLKSGCVELTSPLDFGEGVPFCPPYPGCLVLRPPTESRPDRTKSYCRVVLGGSLDPMRLTRESPPAEGLPEPSNQLPRSRRRLVAGVSVLAVVAIGVVWASVSRPGTIEPDRDRESEALQQQASLGFVFYRGNALPPPPDTPELESLQATLAAASQADSDELRRLYGGDTELMAYAVRDTDSDGILDFRVSEFRGKFFEGDLDVDGDGIRNVYDADPYDPGRGGRDSTGDGVPDVPGTFADADGDGIPDHADWSGRKPLTWKPSRATCSTI